MINLITNNASTIAGGTLHATNYLLGRQTGAQIASNITGAVVGGATEAAAVSLFGTMAEVATIGGLTTLAGIGTAGLALSPAAAIVAGALATVGAQTLLSGA